MEIPYVIWKYHIRFGMLFLIWANLALYDKISSSKDMINQELCSTIKCTLCSQDAYWVISVKCFSVNQQVKSTGVTPWEITSLRQLSYFSQLCPWGLLQQTSHWITMYIVNNKQKVICLVFVPYWIKGDDQVLYRDLLNLSVLSV